jgi:hypothetical protein
MSTFSFTRRSLSRVVVAASLLVAPLAASLSSTALAQDQAPAAGQDAAGLMAEALMPKAPDIAGAFTDAMKTPEAIKAAEEAFKKTAKAYRDAKALTDKVSISVDVMGRKQEQSMTLMRDASGTRVDMGGNMITASNGKVYITDVSVPRSSTRCRSKARWWRRSRRTSAASRFQCHVGWSTRPSRRTSAWNSQARSFRVRSSRVTTLRKAPCFSPATVAALRSSRSIR